MRFICVCGRRTSKTLKLSERKRRDCGDISQRRGHQLSYRLYDTENVTKDVTKKLFKRQLDILQFIKDNPQITTAKNVTKNVGVTTYNHTRHKRAA